MAIPSMTDRSIGRGLELAVYSGWLALCFWRMVCCSKLWLDVCTANPSCKRFLREGWLSSTFDSADDQWRELRASLPILFAAIAAHGFLSSIVRKSCHAEEIQLSQPVESSTVGDKSSNAGKERKNGLAAVLLIGPLGRRRALLNGAYSFVFIGVMHGAHAVFPLALVCGTFVLGHTFKGSRLAQVINWTAAIILVWLKERWYHEFTFERLLGEDFAGLDAFSGMHPWRLSFNLVILRIVSFNLDLHWAELERMESGAGWTSGQEKPKHQSDRRPSREEVDAYKYSSRVSAHRPMADYSLWYYLGYIFYAPLYLAGPTMTFNAYVSHLACPQKTYRRRGLLLYVGRFVFALVLLEWAVHKLPVFALSRSGTLNFEPEILAMYALTILFIMWFKFLVIWRLFRLWALCDGVEPPENMQKCIMSTYSVVGFWKGWHCSFNRWLVRYIYVPLGGSTPGRRWNVFVVTVFVAYWHDVEPKLFIWGVLNGVFLVLEMVIKGLYQHSSALDGCRANPVVNRMIQALGSASNVMVLILVNMIGYAVGIKGTSHVADVIFLDRDGLAAVGYSFAFAFSIAQVNFAIEEAKHRRTRSTNAYQKVARS